MRLAALVKDATRTGETLGPALRGKIASASRLLGKLAAKFPHCHHSLSLFGLIGFHNHVISVFIRVSKLDKQKKSIISTVLPSHPALFSNHGSTR